jgi:hypothetical protein
MFSFLTSMYPLQTSDETKRVTVYKDGGVMYLVDADGVSVLHCAHRSQTLLDMPDAQGRIILPISIAGMRLWTQAVSSGDGTTLPTEWYTHNRVEALCTLATVRAVPLAATGSLHI